MNTTPKIEMQDAQALKTGYSKAFRAVEISAIVAFWSGTLGLIIKVWPHAMRAPWLVAAGLGVGFLLADFTSGFVHWMADTWGRTDLPLLGKALIRPFRLHHVDPKAITHHDYIETNGANCLISVPWAFGGLLVPFDVPGWIDPAVFMVTSIGSMIFWVMMTNQIHKWSHLEAHEMAGWLKWLHTWHLVLPPDHHQVHHTAPFNTYYCITTGWLNWPMAKVGFFRHLERLVTAVTGMIPRKDDIGVDAALAIAPLEPLQGKSQVAEARPS